MDKIIRLRGSFARTEGTRADGSRALVWLAGQDDTSAAHTIATGYDPDCALCWLNHGHTVARHAKAVTR
jgi:hypothetical protein